MATRMRRCEGFSPSRTSGKRPADDHAHGVGQITALEFLLDGHFQQPAHWIAVAVAGRLFGRRNIFRSRLIGRKICIVRQRESFQRK